MNRRHFWVGRNADGKYAKFGERAVNGVGYYVIDTDDETLAVRAIDAAGLMRQLGVQYRRYRPHLIQIDTEVLSQDDWPTEAEVWGPEHAE